MTTVHRDDVTGEEYRSNRNLDKFTLVMHGDCWEQFDVHESEWVENPEAVAELMKESIDEWVESTEQWREDVEEYCP